MVNEMEKERNIFPYETTYLDEQDESILMYSYCQASIIMHQWLVIFGV